ncbi:trypsin-like peptidase domain-containing protein [Candidatus Peregrinibacteria bacterium]|nr:trypsin-like peptidase domain-containing protein [Candidatus Peregrinibacteria bacterium]
MNSYFSRKKLVFFFTLSVFSFFLFLPEASAARIQKRDILSSVVQIITINATGDAAIGSGSTINGDGLILTNHHVVTDKSTGELATGISICYTVSQFKLPRCIATAKVIATNKEFDLALIVPDKKLGKNGSPTSTSFKEYWKKSGKKFFSIPFRNGKNFALPEILDRITVWGYPSVGGSTITVTSGFVSGFNVVEEGEDSLVKFIKTDTAINPGNSGGAAFDKKLSFIGIPSNAWPGQMGFVIPLQTAVEWFKALDAQKIIDIGSIDSMGTYLEK